MIGICMTNKISDTDCDTFLGSISSNTFLRIFYTGIIPHLQGTATMLREENLLLPFSFENSHLYILILYTYDSLPNQVNAMVTLYTLIWESISLILGRNTGYPEVFYFLHCCRQIPVKYLDLATIASLHIFFNSLFTLILIFYTLCSEIMRSSYNKPQKKMRILSYHLTITLAPWWIIHNI